MPMASRLKVTCDGCKIFSKLVRASSTPIAMMSNATESPARYSMRACPNGCSRSAGLPPSLKPTNVMMLLAASDKLFTASAMMDTLPESKPAANLETHNKRLHKRPTTPARAPARVRAALFAGVCCLPSKKRMSSFVTACLFLSAILPAELY
ncbi:hypothetical protein SDC9_148974 [bioreactor metagenome]|uniref:Uncharacterized protein n=1 Tax=bioreactor metagenome TaxID=1076179 RepID=A0A645EKG6_9ZZZZ